MKVGDDAIKISLMQTLPGEEFFVAAALEKACIEAKLEKFAIFKGFGSYDIVFVHAWKDFSSVLTEFGPIPGILKTTKSFCYHHAVSDSNEFFLNLNKKVCAAITIIKISNDDNICCYGSELAIIDEMTTISGDDIFFFGTLGWNELIAINAGDDINDVIGRCMIPSYSTTSKYIQKTYSIFAINYKFLPYDKPYEELKSHLYSASFLNSDISPVVAPIITITCFPGATKKLVSFWRDERYDISDLIGKEDIQILPKPNLKWADVIYDLFSFRHEFKKLIHSTTTYISFSGDVDRDKVIVSSEPLPEFDYDFERVKSICDDKGVVLATTLNTLKGLIKNKIVCDAFTDMTKYHEYVIEFASEMTPKARPNFIDQVSDIINKSAEIRLYGTYGTIEENVGQFNRLRGGVQRSIQAIMLFPSALLKRTMDEFEYNWKGFVSVSNHQFYNSNEVIHVPVEALWNPGMWWAINHEVAHIVINNLLLDDDTGIVDDKSLELKMFLASKNNPTHWLHLITELAAEYIGYELGFYGNYDLFLKKVWTYLKALLPKNLLYSPLTIYAVRTYFVRFCEKMVQATQKGLIYDPDYDTIYEDLVAHIEEIERILGSTTSEEFQSFVADKYILAAYYAPKLKGLLPWMDIVLLPTVELLKCRRDEEEIADSNTNEIFASLEAGNVWEEEIKFPQAVMYKIYQKEELSFNMSMATVLTFWNEYKRSKD